MSWISNENMPFKLEEKNVFDKNSDPLPLNEKNMCFYL